MDQCQAVFEMQMHGLCPEPRRQSLSLKQRMGLVLGQDGASAFHRSIGSIPNPVAFHSDSLRKHLHNHPPPPSTLLVLSIV